MPMLQRHPTSPLIEQYASACCQAGCPEDQTRWLLGHAIALNPKQLRASAVARLCDNDGYAFEVGYGGARGGGKSHWLLAQMAEDCERYNGLQCLLLRKVGKAVRESTENLRLRVLPGVPHEYKRVDGALVFPNGSRILLGHFENESDIDSYLGLEYDVIGVEEATTLTKEKYKSIQTCLRTSKLGWRPRMYSTTNPGGVGHGWYKERFITPWKEGRESTTRFIPATVEDNPCVDSNYRTILDSLDGWQLAAWRHGDWDIEGGSFYDGYSERRHTVITPYTYHDKPPRYWRYFGGLDWGYADPFAFLLCALDSEGTLQILESCQSARLTNDEQAQRVVHILNNWGLSVKGFPVVFDCSMMAAKTVNGMRAEPDVSAYRKVGLSMWPSDRGQDVVQHGVSKIRQLLKNDKMQIWRGFNDELMRVFPLAQHDPHQPEKLYHDETSHLLSALRYACYRVFRPAMPGVEESEDAIWIKYEPTSGYSDKGLSLSGGDKISLGGKKDSRW